MKKRYWLSLTSETVAEFQNITKSMGMPQGIMSTVCDQAISEILKVLKKAQSKGTLTITDLFTMMGEHLENIQQEGKQREEQTSKTKGVVKKPKKVA